MSAAAALSPICVDMVLVNVALFVEIAVSRADCAALSAAFTRKSTSTDAAASRRADNNLRRATRDTLSTSTSAAGTFKLAARESAMTDLKASVSKIVEFVMSTVNSIFDCMYTVATVSTPSAVHAGCLLNVPMAVPHCSSPDPEATYPVAHVTVQLAFAANVVVQFELAALAINVVMLLGIAQLGAVQLPASHVSPMAHTLGVVPAQVHTADAAPVPHCNSQVQFDVAFTEFAQAVWFAK